MFIQLISKNYTGERLDVFLSKKIRKFTRSYIKKLITTDTIDNSKKVSKSKKIEIISMAPMISEAMKRIANSTSVSSLFK